MRPVSVRDTVGVYREDETDALLDLIEERRQPGKSGKPGKSGLAHVHSHAHSHAHSQQNGPCNDTDKANGSNGSSFGNANSTMRIKDTPRLVIQPKLEPKRHPSETEEQYRLRCETVLGTVSTADFTLTGPNGATRVGMKAATNLTGRGAGGGNGHIRFSSEKDLLRIVSPKGDLSETRKISQLAYKRHVDPIEGILTAIQTHCYTGTAS